MPVKKKKVQILKWMCVAQDFANLNFDGNNFGNPGRSGGGGILRDAEGHMIFTFVKYYSISSNNIAKI